MADETNQEVETVSAAAPEGGEREGRRGRPDMGQERPVIDRPLLTVLADSGRFDDDGRTDSACHSRLVSLIWMLSQIKYLK